MNILLVEDDEVDVIAVQRAFDRNNISDKLVLAGDGFDALAKIADHQPNLVFVDIMMPRLDGYQTCALIKKSGKHRETPVIMLSSKDSLFDRARGRMVGSDEYLTKPFTKESLLRAVETHLAHRTAA